MSYLSRSIVFSLPSLLLALSASAQTAGSDDIAGLEEVTVTAQRRSENVQSVPIAVSAFSPAELEKRNITSALDVIQYIPNMNGNNNTGLGSANSYYIRGLGNSDSLAAFDPPVGTYIDDVYIARQNANNFGLFDMERMEVLRGPQGTLFGRNTTGGAVNIILSKPGRERKGFVEVGYGSYNETRARGSFDLPVNDMLSLQLGAFYVESDGYADNISTGDEDNYLDEKGVRLAARLTPSDSVTWDASVNYLYSGSLNLLNFECGTNSAPGTPAGCDERFTSTNIGSTNPTIQNVQISIPNPAGAGTIFVPTTLASGKGDRDMGLDTNQLILTSNLQFDVGETTSINLITGYVHLQQDYVFEFQDGRQGRTIGGSTLTGLPTSPLLQNPILVQNAAGLASPNGSFALGTLSNGDQFSQEIKLSGNAFSDRLSYVSGLYFFREDNVTDFADLSTGFIVPATTLATQVPRDYRTTILADRRADTTTQSWALYWQGDYKLTDRLTATAGIRYTDENKTFEITDLRDARAIPLVAGVPRPDLRLETANLERQGIPTSLSTELWTPRFALNFKPTEDILLFASATRGFRSGGWNMRGGNASVVTTFKPEKVWSYEAGVKSEWFDRRLRANVTLFSMDVEKFQAPSAFVDATGTTNFITRNDADLKNQGVELELQAMPIQGLSLYTTVGYQDAKYENIADSTLVQQQGCLARRATNQVIGSSPGACAQGVVTAQGTIADPVRTPEWTITAGGSYEFLLGIGGGLVLTPAINVSYQDDTQTAANNLTFYRDSAGVYNVDGIGSYVAGSLSEAHTIVNASVSLGTQDDRWQLVIDCDNCSDEVYTQSAISGYSFLNPPRTYSARVRYSF